MTATDPTTTIVAVAIVAGYAWLLVLTTHVQVLSRRLGQHICRDPHPLITVAQLQRRAGAPHLPELVTEDEFDGHSDRVEQDRHPAHAATSSPPCPARPRPCPPKASRQLRAALLDAEHQAELGGIDTGSRPSEAGGQVTWSA